jgi:hypothetical protein
MLQFLQRADDGNMDSTLRTDAYVALVLPELTTCAQRMPGPRAMTAERTRHRRCCTRRSADYSTEIPSAAEAESEVAGVDDDHRATSVRWRPSTCWAH